MIRPTKGFHVSRTSVVAFIGLALALFLRLSLCRFQSDDFLLYTERWYQVVQGHGFSIFRYGFYDYTPPYLYALFLTSRVLPWISPVVATKIPSIVADFICAWYAYRIVRLKYRSGPVPTFAALAILFAPTVVTNSAFWGQTDMLFTAPLVAALYYVLRQKERAVWLAAGLAFSIKPQAIFLAPYLLALLLRRELRWRYVVWAPIIGLVFLLPAWIAGRPIYDLLTIYSSQGALQAGKLTWRAPNLYAWLPQNRVGLLGPLGMLFGAGIALTFVTSVAKSRVRLAPQLHLGLALASVLVMPYVLPSMHERYFFTADVFAILVAFYLPRYIGLAILVGTVSLLSYQPFLFKREIVPMPWLALVLLIGIVFLTRWLRRALYPGEETLGQDALSRVEKVSLYPARDPLFIHKPNGEPIHGITEDVLHDFERLREIVLSNTAGIFYSKPKDVTFLTYNTSPEASLVERCYKAYGIQGAVVLGRGLAEWNWYSKVVLVLEYLESGECDTPFVLVTDATDVLMINDPAPLVDRFVACETEVLFCNTFVDWPPNSQCRAFETATYPDNPFHCRLSAGAYFARTQSLLEYLRRLRTAHDAREAWTAGFNGQFDDQLAWRHLHRQEYPRIKVDSFSTIFRRYDIYRGTKGGETDGELAPATVAS
jgi:Gpi18-like mannosyltransferase